MVGKISNLDKLLTNAFEKLGKLSAIRASSGLEDKRRIQKALFPEGICYEPEKHEYRTSRTSGSIFLVDCLSEGCMGKENGNNQGLLENSRSVPRTGIEPVLTLLRTGF